MDMAPDTNSAIPPVITNLESPKDDKPAVNANGTVNPSDNPMMISDITLGSKVLKNAVMLSTPSSSLFSLDDAADIEAAA